MIELSINNLAKSYGADNIFRDISFDIKTKERVGFIGKNGVGKTTIFKILCGIEEQSSGVINKRKGLKIGYLEQIPVYNESFNVEDVLKLSFSEIYKIEKEMKIIQDKFSELIDNELDAAVKKFSALQLRFETLEGYNIQEKINRITFGLNIDANMLKRKFNALSGGEKTRVMIGKILLEEPDLLLLDEPTNHLDLKFIEWLEEYLNSYEKTVIIISHDRYFLDKVVNKIVELTSYEANMYYGNYSKFVIEKEMKFLHQLKEYENQQRKINKMEEQIKRYRIWGAMRDSDKMYKRAKTLEAKLEKIDKLNKPIKDKKIDTFSLYSDERTGKRVLEVHELSKSFSDKMLFKDLELEIFYKDSVVILGDNGTGKSTLLKIILGEIESDFGFVRTGAKVSIGYLPQEVTFENENIQVVDYFARKYSISTSDARKELAKILFTNDDVFKTIASLSGGEKTKLKLLTLMYEKHNVLLLDEPTNHLDIDSREILEEDLINYDGTLLFVSHDRYFVDKVATKVTELKNHKLKLFDMDFESYMQRNDNIPNKVPVNTVQIVEKAVTNSKEQYLQNKEDLRKIEKKKRDLAKLEENIIQLESEIKLTEEALYRNDKNIDINSEYDRLNLLKEDLEKKYDLLDELYSED